MKKVIVYVFAIIGAISITSKLVDFYSDEKLIRHYYKNCEKVKIGMTLDEAREIIGDSQFKYWTNHEAAGGIIVSEIDGKIRYFLMYPKVYGGSENMSLEFDPYTLKVVKIHC